MQTVAVTAYPRIHLGLIDLGHATARKYGGAGIMLDWPTVVVRAKPSETGSIVASTDLLGRDRADVLRVVEATRAKYHLPRMHIEIQRKTPQHIGLGSKTSTLLACILAMTRACRVQVPDSTLKDLSGRGGVSGVGLHGFFSGGFIADAGHMQDLGPHRPSGAVIGSSAPLLMIHSPIEPSWSFYLILPAGRALSGDPEVDFFGRATPLPQEDVFKSLALMYHGIVPALLTGDLATLRTTLHDFQSTGFKRLEVENQPAAVGELLETLFQIPGVAVGMSSLGPLIYVISDRPREEAEPRILEVATRLNARILAVCRARNAGFAAEVM